ncbi:MAG: hypothetical protein GY839_17275 [candidate division Zixibacteria bacterium]|nr:hypothetical protein [candidate division Zixibacteria bacterium]
MTIKNKLGIKVLGLVVFALLLAVNCAEKGTEADVNIPPNTFITNFQVDISPAEGTTYNSRVSWKGSDLDGAIFWYYWRVIGDADDSLYLYEESTEEPGVIDTINISTWQSTVALNTELELNFPTFDKEYVFEVKAQDNDRAEDPTPAIETISLTRIRDFNYAPVTEFVTAPPDGAICGQGIFFDVKGTDIDGAVDTIAYIIDDDTTWVPTNILSGSVALNLSGLALGAQTITFYAIDNFRLADPTPISRSVIVTDTLAPEVTISIKQDQTFVVPFTEPIMDELTVTFGAAVAFYYSAIDSFVIESSLLTEPVNTADNEITFESLASGAYDINITAYDIGGNSTSTGTLDFAVVELPAGDGVLCINGVDWGTYGEAVDLWENGVAWGDRENFRSWDLFDGGVFGSWADSVLGSGSVPGWMLDTTYFDAVSWMWNSYSGDADFWYESVEDVLAFLEMGGNLFIGGRHGHQIFDGDDACANFAAYCGFSGFTDGLNPLTATAVDASMIDMTRNGSLSFTNVVDVNHANVTQLLEMPDGTPGLGWVILPNGAGGGGGVAYIGGRNYRWTNADLKANIEAILNTHFGIGN